MQFFLALFLLESYYLQVATVEQHAGTMLDYLKNKIKIEHCVKGVSARRA
jgi:hypothetical protein